MISVIVLWLHMLLTFANTSCVCLIEIARIGTKALFEYYHEVKGTKETRVCFFIQ